MLGAELFGRSYGGGILKMEPREAAELPVPSPSLLAAGWKAIAPERAQLDELLRTGEWEHVVDRVDVALLAGAASLPPAAVDTMRLAAQALRRRRTRREN